MRLSPIQESFSSGQVDERVKGRVSSEVYKTGLKRALNWYPLVQGPVRLREGSKYIEDVENSNWNSGQAGVRGLRCFTFQRDIDNDVIIEVGTDSIVAKGQDGQTIIGGVTENLFPDIYSYAIILGNQESEWQPDLDKYIYGTDPGRFTRFGFEAGIAGGIGIGIVTGKGCTISAETQPGGFHGAAIETAPGFPIVLPAGSDTTLNEITFDLTPMFLPAQLGGLDDPKCRVTVGTTQGGNDVYDTQVTLGNPWQTVPITLNFTPGAGNTELYFSIGIYWSGTIVTVPLYGTTWGDSGRGVAIDVRNLSWKAPLAGGSGSNVSFASPYTAEQLEQLQYAMDPGEQVMYFFHPEVETRRLRLATGEWTLEALSTITVPSAFQAPTPNNWGAGNYPATGCFHEGRLYLGGSPSDPATIWGSASGDYQDFNNVAPANKSDPLLFPLSSSGNIKSMTSKKALIINTDISEVVGTSVQGVIAYDDFSFPKQTEWGTNFIQPVVVGQNLVFTSNSRRRVRTFGDEGDDTYGWDGDEISLLAHGLLGKPIRRMVYLDEPSYQAVFLMNDGTLVMATYFYPENVIGWWELRVGAASGQTDTVMDICKVNTSDGAKLWMIINRPGLGYPSHEVLSFDTDLVPCLDNYYELTVDPETGILTGLDRFDDLMLDVVIKHENPTTGEISYMSHPPVTVVSGSSDPLEEWAQEEATTAYVGYAFDNQVQLLPLEVSTGRGTSQVSKRRWGKVYARLNDSAVPLIDGQYPRDRHPATPMGQGEDFVTGLIDITDLGYGEADLVIEQDKALKTELVAIFGKAAVKEI